MYHTTVQRRKEHITGAKWPNILCWLSPAAQRSLGREGGFFQQGSLHGAVMYPAPSPGVR